MKAKDVNRLQPGNSSTRSRFLDAYQQTIAFPTLALLSEAGSQMLINEQARFQPLLFYHEQVPEISSMNAHVSRRLILGYQ